MARFKIEFDGFDKMIKAFERREKNLNSTVEKALKETFDIVSPGVESAIRPHRQSGSTEESLIEVPVVEWNGNVASIKIGFDLHEEVASQFLIYGAKANPAYGLPYRAPDMKLWNALFGSAVNKRIAEAQRKVFERELL